MNKATKIVIWLIVIIVIVLLIIPGKKGESGPIKIGLIGPLTGDAATFGEPISNGVLLAEKNINNNGGINGRMVKIIIEDGKCDGTQAVSAVQKLINIDKVKFIIGGVCSGETLAIAPIVTNAKILVISPSATSPKISGVSKFVFRNAPSDSARGMIIAELLSQTYKKAAIISEKTDYAEGLSSTYINKLKDKGIELVANETYSSETTDFRSILTKIKQTQPDAIYLNPQTPANLVRIANQARAIGITAQFYAAEFNDPTVVGAGKSVEGMIIAVAPNLSTEGKGKDLLDSYKAMYGKEASYPYYVGAAYDDVDLITSGIKKYGEDSTKVMEYFATLRDYNGTIGTYSFDTNGDIVGIKFGFQKIVGGKVVDLK